MPGTQTKMEVGESNNAAEREADRVADAVMNNSLGGNRSSGGGAIKILRREGNSGNIGAKSRGGRISPVPTVSRRTEESINSMRAGGGRTLPGSELNFFNSRFGRDFSDVRIHTGSDAAEAAHDINAKAFTLGNNVFFNRGYFQPGTDTGRRLMAHELTHTVQQRGRKAMIGREVIRRIITKEKYINLNPHKYTTCIVLSDGYLIKETVITNFHSGRIFYRQLGYKERFNERIGHVKAIKFNYGTKWEKVLRGKEILDYFKRIKVFSNPDVNVRKKGSRRTEGAPKG